MRQHIEKVVVNVANGKIKNTKKFYEDFISVFGQKPLFIKMRKKGISFKIKAGMIIGGMCTLRKDRASNFINILKWLVIPNIKAFKGFKKTCINGNTINIGITDISNAMHLTSSPIESFTGFNVSIITRSSNTGQTLKLFTEEFELPLLN